MSVTFYLLALLNRIGAYEACERSSQLIMEMVNKRDDLQRKGSNSGKVFILLCFHYVPKIKLMHERKDLFSTMMIFFLSIYI